MEHTMLATRFTQWKQLAEQAPNNGVQLAATGTVLASELASALRLEVDGEIRRCLDHLAQPSLVEDQQGVPAANGRQGRRGRLGRARRDQGSTWIDAIGYLLQSFDRQLRVVEAGVRLSKLGYRERPAIEADGEFELVDPCFAHDQIVAFLGFQHRPTPCPLAAAIKHYIELVGHPMCCSSNPRWLAGPFPQALRAIKARQFELALREFAGHEDRNLARLDDRDRAKLWQFLLKLLPEIYLDGSDQPDQRLVRFLAPRFLDALELSFRNDPEDVECAYYAINLLSQAEGPFESVPDYLQVWAPRVDMPFGDFPLCQCSIWSTVMWIEGRLGRHDKYEHARGQIRRLCELPNMPLSPRLPQQRVEFAEMRVRGTTWALPEIDFEAWFDLNKLTECE